MENVTKILLFFRTGNLFIIRKNSQMEKIEHAQTVLMSSVLRKLKIKAHTESTMEALQIAVDAYINSKRKWMHEREDIQQLQLPA